MSPRGSGSRSVSRYTRNQLAGLRRTDPGSSRAREATTAAAAAATTTAAAAAAAATATHPNTHQTLPRLARLSAAGHWPLLPPPPLHPDRSPDAQVEQGRVVALQLPDNYLRGALPAAIGRLPKLRVLNLSEVCVRVQRAGAARSVRVQRAGQRAGAACSAQRAACVPRRSPFRPGSIAAFCACLHCALA
jgi:hypothetical protein